MINNCNNSVKKKNNNNNYNNNNNNNNNNNCCIYFDCRVTDSHKMILAHSHVVLLRDRLAGSLRGLILLNFIRRKKYTIFNVSSNHDNYILSNLTCLRIILTEIEWSKFVGL